MRVIAALMASTLALLAVPAPGEIVFTGGGADLTFFYDRSPSEADGGARFDVVFRPKGDGTIATGLDSEYVHPTQLEFAKGPDYTFDKLSLRISDPANMTLNGRDYIGTDGSPGAVGRPDLGIRTRLREDTQFGPFTQFDSLRMTLDWENSTKPVGADFAMWNEDALENPQTIRFETAANILETDFLGWGHSHWHYGFTELGDYDLVFNIQGIGGGLGSSSVGTFRLGVTAVPEPMTGGLLAVGLGCLAVGRFVRRRRSAQGSTDSAEPVAV